ncbi:hypothetical protein OAO87_03700 [bacterium]|nr:hypothetical protein [bacterium]
MSSDEDDGFELQSITAATAAKAAVWPASRQRSSPSRRPPEEEQSHALHPALQDEPCREAEHQDALVLAHGVVKLKVHLIGELPAAGNRIEEGEIDASARQMGTAADALVHHIAVHAVAVQVDPVEYP